MENFTENTGHPILAFLVPFSFPVEDTDADWDTETGIRENSYTSQDVLAGRMPANDRLQQFFLEDCDEYSREYLLAHPYCRIAVEGTFQLEDFHGHLTISIRKEGYGSAIFIVQSPNRHSVEALLKITYKIQSHFQADNSAWLRSILSRSLEKVQSAEPEAYHIGKPYPFYDFYDEGGTIPGVQEFVSRNYRELYGVLHQDVTGWRRTKEELVRGFLAEDLSRRNEYAFYITQVASVEIDDGGRMNSVRKWAEEQNV